MGDMPWTLYRHILKELLKLLTMSLGILVVVIAVAVAVKPLSEGQVGPLTLIKFILLSAPTILDVALPFAAAFAGTLLFHRLASDNEITACLVSGMSTRLIFAPVAFLGLALTAIMFLLSSWVIPEFSLLAAKTIQSDVVGIVVSKLRKDHTFRMGQHVVYADKVEALGLQEGDMGAADSDIKPQRLVMLRGVALGQLDDDGRLRRHSTAERADLLLYRQNDQSWITLRLRNITHYSGNSKEPWGHATDAEHLIPMPNPFSSRLRFKSAAQLRKLENTPEISLGILRLKTKMSASMAREKVMLQIEQAINDSEGKGIVSLLGITDQHTYALRAGGVRRVGDDLELLATDQQPIQVDFYLEGKPLTQTTSQTGLLRIRFDKDTMNLSIDLGISQVKDLRRVGRITQHAQMPPISPLRWSAPLMSQLNNWPVFDLYDQAIHQYPSHQIIQSQAQELRNELQRLGRKIQALRHQRSASSMGCLLVLLISAMLTVQLQGKMPLVIFFWNFLLTAIAVIITRSCNSILVSMDHNTFMGITAIWSGNLILLGTFFFLGWKLSQPRN